MKEINKTIISTKTKGWSRTPLSLHWHGDELVDWARGITRYHLDGSIIAPKVSFSYHFDAVIVSSGAYVALYERLGTKGIILKQGKIVREIDRSFYHAGDYEYPIAFVNLPNGRIGLAHCPNHYNQLEIEDAETGEKLSLPDAKPKDFFHSNLSASSNGHYLLSAGWIWHPFEYLSLFDLKRSISLTNSFVEGEILIGRNLVLAGVTIPSGFVYDENIIFTTENDDYDPNEEVDEDEKSAVLPKMITKYSLEQKKIISSAPLEETAGMIHPFDEEHVLGFYQYPKLIELATGRVIAKWEYLYTGKQTSCIVNSENLLPPVAIDRVKKRFAVAIESEIHVIQLGQ